MELLLIYGWVNIVVILVYFICWSLEKDKCDGCKFDCSSCWQIHLIKLYYFMRPNKMTIGHLIMYIIFWPVTSIIVYIHFVKYLFTKELTVLKKNKIIDLRDKTYADRKN
ncbi:MAG: hypothetical protein FWC41_00060 [Firmicutes bacterium]|nr:hypothetical protein [Bacillota bacterium]